jgi:hypothetical protein
MAGIAIEDEGRRIQVLDGDIRRQRWDHHVVDAVGVEHRLFDPLQIRPHLLEGY